MTNPDCHNPEEADTTRQVYRNRVMLDLRDQLQHQERIIRKLVAERDSLTRELDSRLFLVEAQLRREQKHIESVLTKKEQLIQFQAMQIHSLKRLLSEVSENQTQYQRNQRYSRRSLSKRYSVALDEYMKDNGTVSRAKPVIIQGVEIERESKHAKCGRTRSLPELRFKEMLANQEYYPELTQDVVKLLNNVDVYPTRYSHHPDDLTYRQNNLNMPPNVCYPILSQDVLEELSARRWTSDCDSEHSDSLDSGISSPSIKSRNIHQDFSPRSQDLYFERQKSANRTNESPARCVNPNIQKIQQGDDFEHEFKNQENPNSNNQKPRRSSSIGNFINRTFSSSSSQEKTKDNQELAARRHSSFSEVEKKDLGVVKPPQKSQFISSANRTFGTNHRSVTKPRDIKFRKLFKFRRRNEPEPPNVEDYMTV